MSAIAKLRYMLLSLLVALAFGFTGVAQAETSNIPTDTNAPETAEWDDEDGGDDDDWDWDEEEEEWDDEDWEDDVDDDDGW